VSAFIVSPCINDSLFARITVLPIGEEGELVIGGPQVAQGYLNRPELSAAAFIQDDEFGCLYRTGDKARLLPNRTLECLGRLVSGQVKLRGQRVELGEVEQIISKVDGCHTASVMVIEDNLVAFCAIGSRKVSKSTVTDICSRWLPSHMVPADIVFLPRMPQSAAGKIDKKTLEDSYLQESHRKTYPARRPTSEAGQIILRILHRVLDRDIPLNKALASVGLDSLRAIRIASLLREEGYNVGALDVLSTIDLEELIIVCGSRKIESGTRASAASEFSIFPKLEIPNLAQHNDQITDVLPCTPLQAAMLAETTIKPDAYCNWIEAELSSPHSFIEIRDFLEKLAHNNEILRSGFCTSSSTSDSFAQVELFEKILFRLN
jgi:aryl carrier-like protein